MKSGNGRGGIVGGITAEWLLEECSKLSVASSLMGGILPLAIRIQETCDRFAVNSEEQLQSHLLELVGMEDSMAFDVLSNIVQHARSIQQHITRTQLEQVAAKNDTTTSSAGNGENVQTSSIIQDESSLSQWELEDKLKNDALDALRRAAELKVQLDEVTNNNRGGVGSTHTVIRASHKQLYKDLKSAQRRAATALERARKAGVIMEDHLPLTQDQLRQKQQQDALLKEEMDNFTNPKGLDGMSAIEIQNMLAHQLAREGTKQYYTNSFSNQGSGGIQGLPRGTTHEYMDGYELVKIPAKVMEDSKRRTRIQLKDVMSIDERKAFEGTTSLNPMQSEVFDMAFFTQENLLICAPTGAGKTNVAMLTIVNHFRERGRIVGGNGGPNKQQQRQQQSTRRRTRQTPKQPDRTSSSGGGTIGLLPGTKVVYIAPMKALAQEVVDKFDSKLGKQLHISVKELTGDMQLTKGEAERADIIVTTPEKWDVVTRKGGDGSLARACGLLIIDEIHLLADDRGAVIESVVARLHRTVETTQQQVRLVGLSATLPNYIDVAQFLRVDTSRGLFYFGPEHRPVPLEQTFMGITGPAVKNRFEKERKMNHLAYDVVSDSLRRGHQVMVFVHSRKGTGQTATALAERAEHKGELEELFLTEGTIKYGDAHSQYKEQAATSKNREVSQHFLKGMGIHHAGMLRADRKLTEQMFADGAIRVLCCTATLAWGINLPAHTVVIKGTELYNPEKGSSEDVSILDVMQIFGRAGRPQFDKYGEAFLITTQDAFMRYLDKLVREVPIESNFIRQLPDHLNAEIVAGTVANINEATEWLHYTYLYVRMCRNPLVYGISEDQTHVDPQLNGKCTELVTSAAKLLDELHMIKYHPESGNVAQTDMGRVASYYYIQTESVATFNEMLERKRGIMTDEDLIHMVCCAKEFENVKVRQEELDEVDKLDKQCPLERKAPVEEFSGKCTVLLQAYISRLLLKGFTLISDTNYIAQNGGRVARGLFEMCLKRQYIREAQTLLSIAQSLERRVWWFQTPLRQLESGGDQLPNYCYETLERKQRVDMEALGYDSPLQSILDVLEMSPNEITTDLCQSNNHTIGERIQRLINYLPRIDSTVTVKPLTSSVLRLEVSLTANFTWNVKHHGNALGFWIWVENDTKTTVYHHEFLVLHRRTHPETNKVLEMNVPIFDMTKNDDNDDNNPQSYYVTILSDTFVGCYTYTEVPLEHVSLPDKRTPYTSLLDLTPLPVSALNYEPYEQIYQSRFDTFNPIQTQVFHVLYNTDVPVLVGAPTGSGKTVLAELALMRLMLTTQQNKKCVYIAPLKSLARERLKEWTKRFSKLQWNVLELTGDTYYDRSTLLEKADIFICTPEKWDLLSRSSSRLMNHVGLLILDEIHLLGEERGAVLEAIVSRARLVSNKNNNKPDGFTMPRIVGLSTALANPNDLADWMGIEETFVVPTTSTAQASSGNTTKKTLPSSATNTSSNAGGGKRVISSKSTLYSNASSKGTGWKSNINSNNKPTTNNSSTTTMSSMQPLGRPQGSATTSTSSSNKTTTTTIKKGSTTTTTSSSSSSVLSRRGLYNFRPSVRPVPLAIHFRGFAGRHYVARMASMNKPCYSAIVDYSPTKPVLIFVSSRRQTRLTALDLISYAAADEQPSRFLKNCDHSLMEAMARTVSDDALRHTLLYGIGLHHAGLSSNDRELVETLYLQGYLQVLIATATLAWGVNLPAHLVILKGTEYFDSKQHRYVDYPITDVLQMMGRAGRPQYDTNAIACVFVSDEKKPFYQKFLYDPFPVESCFADNINEHVNAEIVSGHITCLDDALQYLQLTYLARRVMKNPSYYGATSNLTKDVEQFMTQMVQTSLVDLEQCECVTLQKHIISKTSNKGWLIQPTLLGRTASSFYLHHGTPQQMSKSISDLNDFLLNSMSSSSCHDNVGGIDQQTMDRSLVVANVIDRIVLAIAFTNEFDDGGSGSIPVRIKEDEINHDLSSRLVWLPGMKKILHQYATSFQDKKKNEEHSKKDSDGSNPSMKNGGTNTKTAQPSKQPKQKQKQNQRQLTDADLMSFSNVKCYLLLQAYVQRLKLPSSDYINDLRTILDQLPRLLSAFQAIVVHQQPHVDSSSNGNASSQNNGSFDLASIVIHTKQVLSTRLSWTEDDPLQQIPFVSSDNSKTIAKGGTTFKNLVENTGNAKNVLSEALFHDDHDDNNSKKLSKIIQFLEGVPLISVTEVKSFFTSTTTNKKAVATIFEEDINNVHDDGDGDDNSDWGGKGGTMIVVTLAIRTNSTATAVANAVSAFNHKGKDGSRSMGVTILIGTCGGSPPRQLLGCKTLRIDLQKTTMDVKFQLPGGTGHKVVVEVMPEEWRGLDSETEHTIS